MWKLLVTIGMAASIAALTSCSQMAPDVLEMQREDTVKEVVAVDENVPESHFAVVDENGQGVALKLEDGPVLFVAHWCPHCGEYLKTHDPCRTCVWWQSIPWRGRRLET
jgi:hypothetical protein